MRFDSSRIMGLNIQKQDRMSENRTRILWYIGGQCEFVLLSGDRAHEAEALKYQLIYY